MMKNLSTKLFLTLFALLSAFGLKAQNQVKQVIIGSGGLYGNPGNMVTFGAYDPATGNYAVFDSIPGNYTNDAVIDGNHLYINADTTIYKYDLTDYQRLDSLKINGINRMAIKDSILIISTSFGSSSGPYVRFYNKNTLTAISFADNKADQYAEDITMAGDRVYVALVGSWPDYTDSGTVVEFNMANKTSKKIIFDDTVARVVNSVHYFNNKLHAVASVYGTIASYHIPSNSFNYEPLSGSIRGIGTDQNLLWVQTYPGARAFNMTTGQLHASYIVQQSFERGALDTVHNLMYLAATDFATYGRVYIGNYTGQISDTFTVGIAPQAIAVHYISPGGIATILKQKTPVLYPNPANEMITLTSEARIRAISIFDITGKVLRNESFTARHRHTVDISGLAKGVYYLQSTTPEGIVNTQKFIKQ